MQNLLSKQQQEALQKYFLGVMAGAQPVVPCKCVTDRLLLQGGYVFGKNDLQRIQSAPITSLSIPRTSPLD